MKYNVYIVIELKGDPLAEPLQPRDSRSFRLPDGRVERPQKEGARKADPVQPFAD
jgi:hypothetical protein